MADGTQVRVSVEPRFDRVQDPGIVAQVSKDVDAEPLEDANGLKGVGVVVVYVRDTITVVTGHRRDHSGVKWMRSSVLFGYRKDA